MAWHSLTLMAVLFAIINYFLISLFIYLFNFCLFLGPSRGTRVCYLLQFAGLIEQTDKRPACEKKGHEIKYQGEKGKRKKLIIAFIVNLLLDLLEKG